MKLPVEPPDTDKLLHELLSDKNGTRRYREIVSKGIGSAPSGKYRHWDILRHLPAPEGLTHEEWWFAIKMARQHSYQLLPVTDKRNEPFKYALVDILLEMLHQIDEEAITSSQLEGAATTREVAKEMIQTGRQPRNRSEYMIYNNYQAMLFIRRLGAAPLTPGIILEIHKILTENAQDRQCGAP